MRCGPAARLRSTGVRPAGLSSMTTEAPCGRVRTTKRTGARTSTSSRDRRAAAARDIFSPTSSEPQNLASLPAGAHHHPGASGDELQRDVEGLRVLLDPRAHQIARGQPVSHLPQARRLAAARVPVGGGTSARALGAQHLEADGGQTFPQTGGQALAQGPRDVAGKFEAMDGQALGALGVLGSGRGRRRSRNRTPRSRTGGPVATRTKLAWSPDPELRQDDRTTKGVGPGVPRANRTMAVSENGSAGRGAPHPRPGSYPSGRPPCPPVRFFWRSGLRKPVGPIKAAGRRPRPARCWT